MKKTTIHLILPIAFLLILPLFLSYTAFAQNTAPAGELPLETVPAGDVNQIVEPERSESPLDRPIENSGAAKSTFTGPETHPPLEMMTDRSELIRLPRDAASVSVGNPNHISVLLDTPDTLIVVPRQVGASHFSVIGQDGSLIMQRHVIVGAPQEQYVRVRRSCNRASGTNCQETSVYFCPNMCHEIISNDN